MKTKMKLTALNIWDTGGGRYCDPDKEKPVQVRVLDNGTTEVVSGGNIYLYMTNNIVCFKLSLKEAGK